MILAGNQPYFLPYIGYWQLIYAADIFEISDDYQYIDKGWINRNRIMINNSMKYINVELLHKTSNKKINEIEIAEFNLKKIYKQLQLIYARAPYYLDGIEVMHKIYEYPGRNLADFLASSIYIICDYLNIHTTIVRSSTYHQAPELKKEFRIYDLCSKLNCDTYYNAIGGQTIYSFEDFRKHGIKLAFLKTGNVYYRQFGREFVPNLSILDVIMFNSRDDIKEMLNNYSLIEEK